MTRGFAKPNAGIHESPGTDEDMPGQTLARQRQRGDSMDNLTKTDEIFFSRTALDRDRAEAIVRDALAGSDDGELFLEMRHSEMLMIDDGRLKSASYDQSSGFGLRAIAGEAHGYACLLYTSPSPRDEQSSRMPSSA